MTEQDQFATQLAAHDILIGNNYMGAVIDIIFVWLLALTFAHFMRKP